MELKKGFLFIAIFIAARTHAQTQIDTLKNDSLLLLQVQSDMQQPAAAQVQTSAAPSANPDISVIGDMRGLYRSYGTHNFDAVLNEVEFSFQSVIDPYAKADFYYSVGEDVETGEFSSEIEEGYLTTLALPAHLQLKVGRFRGDVGRLNPLHPHALTFIDMPDAYVSYFGEEGLKGDGLSLSWLIPNRVFFQELTAEATNAASESPSFQRSEKNNFLYLVHLKNFWDLTANATLELGLTGINGENLTNNITNIGAVDITYKWKPVQFNTYKSVTFQNEFYFSNLKTDSTTVNSIGFYSMLSVQIAKRYFLTGRYDYTNSPASNTFVQQSGSLTLGWHATEYQKIELGAKYTTSNTELAENNNEKKFSQAFLRWVFIIGTHGAHKY